MFRLLLVIGMGALLLAGCKKDSNVAAQVNAQAAIDNQILLNYITNNNLKGKYAQAISDTTGLWYYVTPQDSSRALYTASTLVTVGYTGRRLGESESKLGTIFIQTDNFHPSFRISQMIKGWGYSFLKSGCGKGKKIRILMASRYAYGPYDQPSLGLPANSILDFEISVYDVAN